MVEYQYIVVFITAAGSEEAGKIARLLLDSKLAACVNTVAAVDSLFWWQGKLDAARESLLIVKTRVELLPRLIAAVKGAHGYQVPEIIALPIIGGNPDYLKWLDDVTR